MASSSGTRINTALDEALLRSERDARLAFYESMTKTGVLDDALLASSRAARTAFYAAMTKSGVVRKRKGKRDG